MEDFITFLKEKKFTVAETLGSLKVTVSPVENLDRDNDIQSPDLRYFLEGDKLVGLHISDADGFNWEIFHSFFDKFSTELKASLKALYLIGNIEGVEFEGYSELTFLHLSENQKLSKISLSDCPKLQELNATHCPILQRVELVGVFSTLKKLDVSNSKIEELILPKKLDKLRYLNFSFNSIKSFEFLEPHISVPLLFGQNSTSSNETISGIFSGKNDEKEIRKQLNTYFKAKKITINQNKLILLGNTQAGKTTLCDILRGTNEAEKGSTHGVNIFPYKLPNETNYHVYDFRGQDFYHNTHLAFFGKDAKYILVHGNGQRNEFGQKKATDNDRLDDIFPMNYWLESVFANIGERIPDEYKATNFNKYGELEFFKIKLATLQNKTSIIQHYFQDQKMLHETYGVSDFFDFNLKNNSATENPQSIKEAIDTWLINNNHENEDALKEVNDWRKYFELEENKMHVVVPKKALLQDEKGVKVDLENTAEGIEKTMLDFLEYSFVIYQPTYELKNSKLLEENIIVNIGVFTNWIYAILNLENLLGKGEFNKEDAKKWLVDKKFKEAVDQIDFIIDFLLEYKMIFQIKGSENYLVPQYLPEPQYPADKHLLKMFEKPFLKYEFTGFYHTQLLTDIIAEYFESIVAEQVGKTYKYLIWKNKVILYTHKLDTQKKEGKEEESQADELKEQFDDYLLVEFKLEDRIPTLQLSEIKQNTLRGSIENLKKIIKFIDSKLKGIANYKMIKTSLGNYINADLLNINNLNQDGKITDLIYDAANKQFYRLNALVRCYF